ncbi:ABC transporter-like [Forsythia ovata]|uniref:ABC transporter-like n=1 Tax=Forsythia ovata TaxID=205694 RepID=A0ABD1RMM6_9LAMI
MHEMLKQGPHPPHTSKNRTTAPHFATQWTAPKREVICPSSGCQPTAPSGAVDIPHLFEAFGGHSRGVGSQPVPRRSLLFFEGHEPRYIRVQVEPSKDAHKNVEFDKSPVDNIRWSSWLDEEDEEALRLAAIQKLPTYDRLRKTSLKSYELTADNHGNFKVVHKDIDVRKLDMNDRKEFIDMIFKDGPSIRTPSYGKTTLLLAPAGKLDHTLKTSGEIAYNGHKLNEFVPQKTSAYISQNDVHASELTGPAPETFDLFDDIILLSEGQIVYQDSREHVVDFFESRGFKCPDRKATADFLQEVIT